MVTRADGLLQVAAGAEQSSTDTTLDRNAAINASLEISSQEEIYLRLEKSR